MVYQPCLALFIHETLGIDMVMTAFVRYMAFVKGKIHPNQAYVDTYNLAH